MNAKPDSRFNRRQWLQLSASALLGLGCWPGCARWAHNGKGGTFRFIAINDTHFQSPQCPAWFEQVRASVRTLEPKPEFCLMIGDLSEHGTRAELGAMQAVLRSLDMPHHVVIGNHDYGSDTARSAWDELFPHSLNYHFEHRGWRFLGLDSTQGREWQKTRVQSTTLKWLDDQLPKLNPTEPTVVFTHFPLGQEVSTRPSNADELLARFKHFNLAAALNGHFHGFTERRCGPTVLTTNRCCAISRNNHDRTSEKGYFLCTAQAGQIQRQFIEVKPT
ncbi:MAG TPA: metallophosphoesterase [Bacillota bacterium]|nr:metallophosphoesterase [Bacillota bacterium]